MPALRRLPRQWITWRPDRDRWLAPPRFPGLVFILAVSCGLLLGHAALAIDSPDVLVAGNTGGTLSVMLRLNGATVVIGGGEARPDLAELVDRSSLPWDRRIDLLVVPAWDARHAAGALGLIERGGVQAVAIIGPPPTEPPWSLLQSAALQTGARITIVTAPHRVVLPWGEELLLALEQDPTSAATRIGATIELRRQGARFVIIDGDVAEPPPLQGTYAVITLRPAKAAAAWDVPLLLRPDPQVSPELRSVRAQFFAEIKRGQRLTLRLEQGEVRISSDHLTPRPSNIE